MYNLFDNETETENTHGHYQYEPLWVMGYWEYQIYLWHQYRHDRTYQDYGGPVTWLGDEDVL